MALIKVSSFARSLATQLASESQGLGRLFSVQHEVIPKRFARFLKVTG